MRLDPCRAAAGACAVLLSLTMHSGMAQVEHASSQPVSGAATVGLPSTSIIKFAQVTPNLFRGGQPNAKGLEQLKQMGIDIVVDMRSGSRKDEKAAVRGMGMEYFQIAWHCPLPTDAPFAKFLKIVEDNPGKKVFVHCRLGDDRTGMAIAAYRMAEQGWSADEALQEMHDLGFDWKHHLICPTLAAYEKSFPERLKKDEAFKDLRIRREQSK